MSEISLRAGATAVGVETPKLPALLYLVDWLPPEFGATGQYAQIAATDLARAGRDVSLIGLTTAAPSTTRETIDRAGRLTTRRLHADEAKKSSYLARMLWALATGFRITRAVIALPESRNAEIIFTGSPPFMLYFAIALKLFRGARLTYRITDFYPEVVIAAASKPSPFLEAVGRLTWALRRRVDRFQVLGEDQRALLIAGGVDPGRISLLRDRSPVDITGHETPLSRPAELKDRLVLLYSGNFGVAHDVDTTLAGLTAQAGKPENAFGLWINGAGANADRLAGALRQRGVAVARTPALPLAQLAALLVSPDAHLITLRPGFAGLVLPSKVYGCIASGKPILFVGPATSDVHLLCSQAEGLFYRRIEPGDTAAFGRALEALAAEIHASPPLAG